MRTAVLFSLAATLAAQAPPVPAPPPVPGSVQARQLAGKVESSRLRRTVERLAAFGTRHSLSSPLADQRGIGAARRWLVGETRDLALLPGSRLVPFVDVFTAEPGPRVPKPTEMVNVGVVLPGLDPSRAKDALVVCGHYDSRANDVMDADADAPGAVDDASGVALVLEMAQVMAADRTAVSIYFVATAGEEQGLLGAAHLARRLKAEGVNVLGMLAADCVGNTAGPGNVREGGSARLFSESVPAAETEAQRKVREAVGGENDSPSREFARYLKRFGERYQEGLDCMVMLRKDRIGRGGDHLAFNREGYPAARLTETLENFDRQHQVPRVENGKTYGDTPAWFDPGYCARLTRAMVGAFHHLALAPDPPRNVTLAASGSPRLSWAPITDPRVAAVVIYRRRADQVLWQQDLVLPPGDQADLAGIGVDSFYFAVAFRDREGNESLPVAPGRLE